MTFTIWFVIVGLLLIGMALGGSVLRRLPVTTSVLYLAVGVGLGPYGVGLLSLDPLNSSGFLHRLAEIAVIVSLFTAGLKLRLEWRDPRWHLPVRLAVLSMILTVGMIAVAGVAGLGLSLGLPSCWALCWRQPIRFWHRRLKSKVPRTGTCSG